jgi:2-methylcitrate dehydratase PrpD
MTVTDPGRELAAFAATLRYDDLPQAVVRRIEELFLDWFASALAGRNAPPVRALEGFAQDMGPADGPSEILVSRRRTTPWFAALVNAASSHVVEQDDVHNGAVFHPGSVVFPTVLAVAQQTGANGREFIAASVAGYEAGVRIGEFLGRSHYRVFHTTGTAGTVAAAAAAARLLQLDAATTVHALGSAGTQAAGLWEFLRDAADSKQLHTAKAAADGLLAAYLARDGVTGAQHILDGPQGMAAGMSSDADPARLSDRLGRRWAVTETSFKYHASCRHTHPAADALLKLMQENSLPPDRIARVRAHVYQVAIDVLGSVTDPQTVHQTKFSMGFVLALIALHGRAGVNEFTEAALADPRLRALHDRVAMRLDPKIDALYPQHWAAKVEVETTNGERLSAFVDTPKGDPGNTLSRLEIEDKAQRLAAHRQSATPEEMRAVIARVWQLHDASDVRDWFAKPPP